jgi:diguanylate cyclase (GGDEF)-like protein
MSEPEDAPGFGARRDILEAYRERIMRLMALAGVIFLTPFAVTDLIAGNFILGGTVLVVVVILAIDALAIQIGRRPPIPFFVLLLPMGGSIALSLMEDGVYGALWSYPAVLFCYFALPRRTANIGSLALSTLAAVMSYLYVGSDVTLRFVVSLGLTIVIINIILNIISQLQKELMDQAITDPLTGAFNRRQMDQSLAEAIERNRRTGAPVSVLVIDIDHFKKVNDEFGHHVGDKVLKGLVTLISNRSRKLDRLFRMGGEEFVLLLPDTRAGTAMKQAEVLRKLVAEAKLIDQRAVTVSIGVAEFWADQTQEQWMKAADDALYQAKGQGRNRVVCGSADSDSMPGLAESPDRRFGRAV